MIWEIFIVKLLNYLTIAANRPNWKLWNATYYPHFNQNDEGFRFQLNPSYEKSINCVAVTPSYNSIPLPPTLITYYEIVQHILHSLNSWQYSNDSTLQSLWWLSVIVSELKAVGSWERAQMRLKQQQLTTYHRILFIKVKDTVELHSFVQQHRTMVGNIDGYIQAVEQELHPLCSRYPRKKKVHKYFFVCHPPLSYLNSIKKN